jgi:asparagine synthase (glutamine-hydrolysing)
LIPGMFRYLIVVGDPQNPSDARSLDALRTRHERSPEGWKSAVKLPGFYAAYVEDESSGYSVIPLEDQCGVIFGRLFRAGSVDGPPEPVRHLSRDLTRDVIQSAGRSLIPKFWGYYVAALRYPERAAIGVLRAPASLLACCHMKRGTLDVFFSDLEDCAPLGLSALSVNWDSITAQVVGGDYLTDETAIKNITALECGESIEYTAGGCTRRQYWDPRDFLRRRSLREFSAAACAMRGAVDHSVSALSTGHDRILVNLSGGLDSSIVLGALARAPHKPRLTAVNYHSRGCGDERPYARIMARSVDCRLVELPRNHHLDLRCFEACNVTVRPMLNFSASDAESRNAELARQGNISAIFDGELGDNVFGRTPGPGALLECIRGIGFGSYFLSVARDYAMLTRQSIWRTLALTYREHRQSIRCDTFSSLKNMQDRYGQEGARSLRLASTDAERQYAEIAERFIHPWFRQARSLAADSYKILFGLVMVTAAANHSPFASSDGPQRLSPLISQPVVETALLIPGYLHCNSARDRPVARAAFAATLPVEIVNRGTGKGGPTMWLKDVVENNSGFVREFLIDGLLAGRGLIDRNKVEAVLSPRIVKSTAMIGDIFAKLYIEAWLRNFTKLIGGQ